VAITAAAALSPSGAVGAPAVADTSGSPYFVVDGAAPGVEALPLRSTATEVHIAGVIADVVVTQVYRNDGAVPIHARYVFPASTRAAVYGMKMTVGARTLVAQIRERAQARRAYEEAKRAGKRASLLEQDRPNVFSMNVANILPGDVVTVELRYTELLVPTEGTYELVVPSVVGPRYVGAAARAAPVCTARGTSAIPYQWAGAPPSYGFDLSVTLDGGMPIRGVSSPSHAIHTAWGAHRHGAAVTLEGNDPAAGTRDFVLRYRLAGREIASGLLLYQGADESFFVLTVQPPPRPPADLIPPREYVFIVDVSGSMSGFPLDTSKTLLRGLVGRLRPVDRFNVVLFAGGSSLYASESVTATAQHIDDAIAWIDGQHSGGGTELLGALRRAMALPQPPAAMARSFVVVTDGYIYEDAAMFDYVRDHLGDASVFAFGIGTSVNRHLIEGLAHAGLGEPFVVLGPDQADAVARRFRRIIEAPVLTDVHVAYDGLSVYDVQPASIPDVFAERPVVVLGKYRGAARGTITLSGVSGRGRFVDRIDVSQFTPRADNRALAYLWARNAIAQLSDFGGRDEHRDAIVALGLRYNLLTAFTSFVAVEQVVRRVGEAVDVTQPVPLPGGVQDEALDMEVGPEPPLAWLIALALAALAVVGRRRRRAGGAA